MTGGQSAGASLRHSQSLANIMLNPWNSSFYSQLCVITTFSWCQDYFPNCFCLSLFRTFLYRNTLMKKYYFIVQLMNEWIREGIKEDWEKRAIKARNKQQKEGGKYWKAKERRKQKRNKDPENLCSISQLWPGYPRTLWGKGHWGESLLWHLKDMFTF